MDKFDVKIDMSDTLQKDLYNAFFATAEKYGDEIFTMSCYAKHGFFAAGVDKESSHANHGFSAAGIDKESSHAKS